MARIAQTQSRVLPTSVLLLSLLFPAVALADWGDENWGAMVWGGFPTVDIPALPVEAIVVLATILLGLSYWLLVTRRRRAKRPSLYS